MRLRLLFALGIAAMACGGAGGARTEADGPTCVAMFQRFDLLQDIYPNNNRRYQNRAAPPPVELQAQIVRNAGCVTLTAELAPMAGLAPRPIANGGRAIAPTRLHVGVVTNMQDDAAVLAFFEASGIPARSLGSAPLGRQI